MPHRVLASSRVSSCIDCLPLLGGVIAPLDGLDDLAARPARCARASQIRGSPAFSAKPGYHLARLRSLVVCSSSLRPVIGAYPSAALRALTACAMAPRAAGVSASAFSMTKSWIVPLYRVEVTRTPTFDSRRA